MRRRIYMRRRSRRALATLAAGIGALLVVGASIIAPGAVAANSPQDDPAPALPQVGSTTTLAQASSSSFQAIGTALAYDSANGDGPMQPGTARIVSLSGLPTNAHSALILMTAHDASAAGEVTVSRTPTGRAVAKFDFIGQATKSAVMLVPVSEGHVFLTDSKASSVNLKVNLLGFGLSAAPPMAQGRPAVALAHGMWKAGTEQTVALAHQYGTPGAKKLVAALLKITTHQAAAPGGVQVYPLGSTPPGPVAPIVSGQETSTIALVPTGKAGQLNISSTVDARVRVDLIGYVADSEAPATSAVPAPAASGSAQPPGTSQAPATGMQPLAQVEQETGATGPAAVAVQYALSKIGDRYVASTAGPDTFDCSGLTMAAWAAAGVKLTHLSYTQYDQTQHIALSAIQPGDLLFYFGGGVHHVTMYIGHGLMANAANHISGVVITAVSEGWYMEHLAGVGHVDPSNPAPSPSPAVTASTK